MYKLPQDYEKIQNFAQQEGEDCAKAINLSQEDFEELSISQIAKSFFVTYTENEKICDDEEWAEEIFTASFQKGFIISQNEKF